MKNSRKKKWWIILGMVVLVLLIQTPLMYALSKGYFAKGNAEFYSVNNTPTLENSALHGKTIIFLGSSVTMGTQSKGDSFIEYMEKRNGIIPVEETVSGTTLVDNGGNSYIQRMKTLNSSIRADVFICQLSTNDASKGFSLGEIAEGTDLSDFDTSTITGAMEYIIAYAKETWGCPVIFYTGTRYDSSTYESMVARLLELQEKWGIGVIDLWNDQDMNAVSKMDYKLYMFDSIHPTRAGYREWWTPKFEEYLVDYLAR